MASKPSMQALQKEIQALKAQLASRMPAEGGALPQPAGPETQIILDSLVEHVIYQDLELKILWANRAACESVGLSRETLTGRFCYEIWPQRREVCPDCPVSEAMSSGQPTRAEKTTPDGRTWVIRGQAVRDATGKIVGGVETTLEITAQKAAETALRQSEERLRAITQNISEVFWLFDIDQQRVVYVSPAYEEIWGRPTTALLEHYEEWQASIHPDDLAYAESSFAAILETGGGEPREYRIVRPDGTVRWISDRGFAIRNPAGEVIQVTGVAEDITERKAMQATLQDINTIISKSPIVAFLWQNKAGWPIQFVTSNVAALLGYTAEQLMSGSIDYRAVVHPDDRERVTRAVSDVSVEAERREFAHEPYRVITHNGDIKWVEDKTFIRRDPRGRITHFQGLVEDVTLRKRAEDALRASEANYRQLFSVGPDAIILVDMQTQQIVDANPAAVAQYGYPHEELCGKSALALSAEPEASAAHIAQASTGVPPTKSSALAHRLHKKKDGTVFPVEIAHGFYEHQGRRLICAIIRDLTARKAAEAQLKEARLQVEAILNNIPDLAWLKDAQSRFIAVNEAFGQACGVSPDRLPGQTDLDIWPKDLAQRYRADDQEVLGSAQGKRVEEPLVDRQGQTSWIETIKSPLFNPQGQVIGTVGIARDITEHKTAREALQAEKERLAVTLRSIDDAVITTDANGTVMLMNPLAESLTGYREQEAIGQPITRILCLIDEDTRETCQDPVARAIAGKPTAGLANQALLLRGDGTEMVIAESEAPILGDDGRVIGVVLVFRDITEQRRLQQELAKVQKIESLGVMAGGIAHDFNNFLTGILGNLSLVKLETPPEASSFAHLIEMENAALRAKDLTQQLLTFAKGGDPVKRPVAIGRIVQETASFALRGSNVRCEFDLAQDLSVVEADEGQIAQVINNIVINADQAMPDGGKIRVRATNVVLDAANPYALAPGTYVRIECRDEGVGIAPEHLNKVFDPYFSTKQKGSGLGLTMAYAVIDKHQGRLDLQSSLGQGTVSTILLPASAAVLPAIEGTAPAPFRGSGRILVMDDEALIRDVLTQMLQMMGFEVVTAEDGDAALAQYQQAMASGQRFDLVIMDLTIPGGMGGRETIGRLREMDPEAKALVSSGYSGDPVMSQFERFGFSGVVRKPYRIEELSDALRRLLAADGPNADNA
jgi:PAS domain S-box-containing protein